MPEKTEIITFCLGILITAWGFVRYTVPKATCIAIRGDCAKLHQEKDKSVDNRLAAIQATLSENTAHQREHNEKIEKFMDKIMEDFYKPHVGGRQ